VEDLALCAVIVSGVGGACGLMQTWALRSPRLEAPPASNQPHPIRLEREKLERVRSITPPGVLPAELEKRAA
jgi:hypothetical protein